MVKKKKKVAAHKGLNRCSVVLLFSLAPALVQGQNLVTAFGARPKSCFVLSLRLRGKG
jgi:hypothetical protein